MSKNLLSNERGAVALVTVMFTSILVVIITVGAVRLMVGELGQAQNAENGTVAQYVAQSAAEEGVAAVITKLKNPTAQLSGLDQSCSSDKFGSGASATATTRFSSASDQPVQVTCRRIVTSGSVKNKQITKDQVDQYDLSGATMGLQNLSISWSAVPKSGGFVLPATGSIAGVKEGTPWYAGAPVPLEVTVTGYDATRPDGAITIRNVILQPVSSTSANNTINVTTSTGAPQVYCAPNGNHDCKVTLVGLSNPAYKYVVRVKPRFGDAIYDMSAIKNGGGEYQIRLQKAHIDVTVRVGSALRRVTRDIPVRTGAFAGLDTVLYGDVDLCKNLQIFSGGSYSSSDIISRRGETTCDLKNPYEVIPDTSGTAAPVIPTAPTEVLTNPPTQRNLVYDMLCSGSNSQYATNYWYAAGNCPPGATFLYNNPGADASLYNVPCPYVDAGRTRYVYTANAVYCYGR